MALKPKALTTKQIMDILKINKAVLHKYNVKKIGLFGSYAGGNQGKGSDVDFLVEFTKPSFDNFMDLAYFLEAKLGKKVDLITNGNLSPYIKPYVDKEVKWYEA